MPTEQAATQLAQAALQAPINTLVVLVAIIALIIVLGVGFLMWKFAPIILRQIQQQIETNAKLTKIIEDGEKRAEQRTTALSDLSKQTANQTTVLNTISEKTDKQTNVLEIMGKTFGDHQIATHETVANLSDKVDGLEKTVNSNSESIVALTEQIKNLITKLEDKAACAEAEERMRKIRDEILDKLTSEQAKRATGTTPAVVIPDDPQAGADKAA